MATYKVPQDIEAEDKFIGPLTLKQFIFAAIAVVCLYLSIWSVSKDFPYVLILTGPIILAGLVLAWPWSRDQPTEVWLFAKVRFFLKPHRRIWDQTGMKHLVTITAPKTPEKIYTDGLDEAEVTSRLKALANTIDSRGWATKNVNVNLFTNPAYAGNTSVSDRLVAPAILPQSGPAADISPADDIMDVQSNPVAYKLDQLVKTAGQTRRQNVSQRLQQVRETGELPPVSPTQPQNLWFANQSADDLTPEEQEVLKRAAELNHAKADSHSRLHTVQPASDTKKRKRHVSEKRHKDSKKSDDSKAESTKKEAMTPPSDPAILKLASNDDLNVATLARQADQARKQEPPSDEVVVKLR